MEKNIENNIEKSVKNIPLKRLTGNYRFNKKHIMSSRIKMGQKLPWTGTCKSLMSAVLQWEAAVLWNTDVKVFRVKQLHNGMLEKTDWIHVHDVSPSADWQSWVLSVREALELKAAIWLSRSSVIIKKLEELVTKWNRKMKYSFRFGQTASWNHQYLKQFNDYSNIKYTVRGYQQGYRQRRSEILSDPRNISGFKDSWKMVMGLKQRDARATYAFPSISICGIYKNQLMPQKSLAFRVLNNKFKINWGFEDNNFNICQYVAKICV